MQIPIINNNPEETSPSKSRFGPHIISTKDTNRIINITFVSIVTMAHILTAVTGEYSSSLRSL